MKHKLKPRTVYDPVTALVDVLSDRDHRKDVPALRVAARRRLGSGLARLALVEVVLHAPRDVELLANGLAVR